MSNLVTWRWLVALALLLNVSVLEAQVRVTPKKAKGGTPDGQPWANVPEEFRRLKVPEWPLPTDRARWEQDRLEVRRTLLKLLGEMPPRPSPAQVKVVSREDRDGYTLEKIEFFNGVDALVPGLLLIPKNRARPAPAIIGAHGHGTRKEDICIDDPRYRQDIGPMLARRGYVVAAIDSYFCGERVGHGPAGRVDGRGEEASLFKWNLWLGRTLWGMMIRDQQCLLDYLETRPEVDKDRIGVTGLSMGCTTSYWLTALDERIKLMVGVVCFTRYTELFAHAGLRHHGIYYFVPGVLAHFDTEAIFALAAPRPVLMLSGDQDPGAPTDGIEVLEKKLLSVYRLHGKEERFRSVVYRNTGHEYLPEMKDELVQWLDRYLPVGK